jgi:tRNA pseudouridine55 synthase
MLITEENILSIDYKEGAMLLVDKPLGWTSFDVVNKIRYVLTKKLGLKKLKVGHAGTLDPLATGLLVICIGKFTKQLNELQDFDKSYTGTFFVGATTPSHDRESMIDAYFPTTHITPALLESSRQKFVGTIAQVPPIFSAIKVDGKPVYKSARAGKEVILEARNIHIYHFGLTNMEIPEIEFEVTCSKGTYIRSLAYDFGKALQSGAFLSALRRTQIGDYEVKTAWNLQHFIQRLRSEES